MEWMLVRNSSKPDRYYLYVNKANSHSFYVSVRDETLSLALFTSNTETSYRSLVARHELNRTPSMRNDLASIKMWASKELATPMDCLVTGILNAR
jgi:subtilase family serine protease